MRGLKITHKVVLLFELGLEHRIVYRVTGLTLIKLEQKCCLCFSGAEMFPVSVKLHVDFSDCEVRKITPGE